MSECENDMNIVHYVTCRGSGLEIRILDREIDMARPLRIEFPGAVYHVTSRGNRRARIFRNDNDMTLFLEVLGHLHDRFGWLCYACETTGDTFCKSLCRII